MKNSKVSPETPPQNLAVALVGVPLNDVPVPPGSAWSHCQTCGARLTFHPVPSALLDWLDLLDQDLAATQDHLTHLKQILEEVLP